VARAAAPSTLLAPTVDDALGRVQIQRHILGRLATKLAVKLVVAARRGPLDRADVARLEPAGELPRGRRRRGVGHRPQRRAGLIGAQHLKVVKALRARQLRLSDRDHQPARRQSPPALLHRRHPIDRGKLSIDQLHQPQITRELTTDRQPRIRRQRRIVRAELDPSGASGTVNDDHPLGGPDSPSPSDLTTRTVTVSADGKPRIYGAFPRSRDYREQHSTTPATDPTAATHRSRTEDHHQLLRHARRATPRTHPPRVLGTTTPDDHQPKTHTTPLTVSPGGRLNPESRATWVTPTSPPP